MIGLFEFWRRRFRPAFRTVTKIPVVLTRGRRLPLTIVPGTNSRVVSQSVSLGPKLRGALNDVLGGSAASVLTVTFGLSYALLIFAGPLAPYLSYGVAATFISSAVLAAVIAVGSSLPFAVGGAGELHRGDDGDTGVVAGRTNGGDRSDRAAAGAGADHPWPSNRRHRSRALRLRHDADGPRDPLCALSGGRRISRRDRLPDRVRRDPRHHRPSACNSQRSTSSQICRRCTNWRRPAPWPSCFI